MRIIEYPCEPLLSFVICRRISALALQRMLEEDFYFCMQYCNWQRDDYYYKVFAPRIFSFLPGPIYPVMIRLVRATVLRDLHGQVCFLAVRIAFHRTAFGCHKLTFMVVAYE
jgi:hypothetical protein